MDFVIGNWVQKVNMWSILEMEIVLAAILDCEFVKYMSKGLNH